MSTLNAFPSDRCPRCGGTFHCGINDSGPCVCTTVTLAPEIIASLRDRYTGCLCVRCLADLAQGAEISETRLPGG